MNASWLQWLRGIVTVSIRGEALELLVNRALASGLSLWSIRRTSQGELLADLTIKDFFQLRPLLKGTGSRIHVQSRRGLPFWLVKLEKRLFFGAGLILFFIGMYLLSSLIWNIDIKGNERLSEEQIMQAARQEGLYPFQWSFRLENPEVLSRKLTQKLPGAAWIGVEKQGTKITIQVVETAIPEPRKLLSPRHLVASADAVVTEILAEAGRPVVKRNTKVKEGDVLISGIYGDEAHTRTVVAKGIVKGLVWHEYSIVSPLQQKVKAYTGESKVRWYAVAWGRGLRIGGFGKIPYTQYETQRHLEQASWRTLKMPFGRMKETVREVRFDHLELTEQDAKQAGLLQARADLLTKAGPGAKIRAENILHEKADNGKVYMKVLFEVEQSIVTERPLVHIQGD
ncbi:sporulation protein YqfD [Paenibacillus nasutitermitis]|uniref:Sporulation protein YqfD n=1 Tax=Paenibacillus nasutitermitis TaxID=1652958 RepID=A0A916Z1C7_9BACL|nr:sporulation protein YqfD [Paenibacillus nasutitermitis]GGD71417.1 sporulation protein YqfD [Paenibacillus nasutitermitis]